MSKDASHQNNSSSFSENSSENESFGQVSLSSFRNFIRRITNEYPNSTPRIAKKRDNSISLNANQNKSKTAVTKLDLND